ncbi:glycosyltransferase [Prauserella cavernicola]|uniref:Glycosyltransferase n=1 Tax=Prauserella cavernicola TaxID=2800127 RepID=A0A934QPP0_9PSEU|nr:glycosyltransferase [Prauserella cavernicola]MBK1784461.1 glycosyltransferase [Prauserella cavernicola]
MGTGPRGERLIEWTGERCVPWADDLQVIYEHYHRYAFALRFTEGKRVLDLASGEGFGSALLAAKAAQVVGIDIDPVTVEHARQRYPLGNARFEVASIIDPDACAGEEPFDVITCFEAVEHVEEQDQLMELVARRLAPGGIFLCSTPDVDVYTHDHGNENPYHVRELHEGAFRELLGGRFEHVRLLRQNVAVGSLIHDGAEGGGSETHTLSRSSSEDWAVDRGAPHTYFVGIASAEPVEVPDTSVLVDPKLTLVQEARAGEIASLSESVRALTESVRTVESELRASTVAADDAEARARSLASERDAALERVRRAEESYRKAVGEGDQLRRKATRDAARLSWLSDNNNSLRGTINQLAGDNAKLAADHSELAQKLLGRYRSGIERLAPRGTRRRDAYEKALGRQPGIIEAGPSVPGPVAVTTSDQPVVSVVVPIYGNWEYTRRCLESIEVHLPITPLEVIVVDDASPDDTADRVAQCAGVRLVRAPRNLGFIGASNLGAEHARGELIMFLNNDTEARPGWLDKLVQTFDDDALVGLAGSRLVYPDGRLQESGGIVWRDGSGWNYGRGGNPDDPRHRTMRDVDYCSGAALLVRRDLFERIGGFDTRYAPAYYEDTDLAFAVRDAGYRTVVQPESVIVHHEGVSNGTDVGSGIKRHQELNRVVFAEKWATALAEHLPEASPRNVWLGRARGAHGHHGGLVLVADHQVPRTLEDSGSVRMARLLDLLVELGERVVFFPMNGAIPEEYMAPLHRAGITVIADHGQQQEFLRDAGESLSLALLSRPQVAWQLLEPIRQHAPRCLVAYDTVDLHFLRLQRQAELAGSLGESAESESLTRRAEALRELELGLVRACDVTFTVSEVERKLLAELTPDAEVQVLSNVHEADVARSVPEGRSGVLFVGSFDHVPNRDAAAWLAEEIMPLVRERHLGAEAHIVGSNPPPEVEALASDGVVVHGWVEDLAAQYEQARVVVAPLRFGAGVKGKVGEALARGVPVAGTTLATEGMFLADGEEVLLGETAAQLAERVGTLLADDALWLRISEAGKEAVNRRFGPGVAKQTLASLLRDRARAD